MCFDAGADFPEEGDHLTGDGDLGLVVVEPAGTELFEASVEA